MTELQEAIQKFHNETLVPVLDAMDKPGGECVLILTRQQLEDLINFVNIFAYD